MKKTITCTVCPQGCEIEAEFTGAASGHDLDLGGEEILFLDVVLFLEDGKDRFLNGFLFLFVRALNGLGADDNVQRLAFDNNGALLAHLVRGKMREQVGDADHGVLGVLADNDVHKAAVLLGNHAMHRKGHCDPLILLDAAIIMRVQIRKAGFLIHGVLLEVDAGRVDMRAHDVHTLFKGLLANHEKHDGLAHAVGVDAIARAELFALGDNFREIAIAMLFRKLNGLAHAFALGLAIVEKLNVVLGDSLELFELLIRIGGPCNFSFHIETNLCFSMKTL